MLIVAITLLGILTIAMAVYGAYLTSSDPRHQKWFIRLGIAGVLLVFAQGYYLYRDDKEKFQTTSELRESVKNLRAQTAALMNAIRLQASLDDFKYLEGAIVTGFAHLEAIIQGKKLPVQPPQQLEPFQPAIVAHLRVVQHRAASTDPEAKFGLQVIMQTDIPIQPVAFGVKFDNIISSADAFIVGEGNYTMKATSISSDRKSFMFSFHSPAFTPSSCLVVTVQSKYDIRVTKVEKLQQPLY
jgi:hypothetical protein